LQSKAEADIWMQKRDDNYEYIGVYVDDLSIIAHDPKEITYILVHKYKFKLKGTGPITYHLGMDVYPDNTGSLCILPKKYIENMIASYEQFFGSKPSQKCLSPLEKGDHPEFDTSDYLDDTETQCYQSLIVAMQWAILIGRFDIITAVMTLSSFCALPRQGHMDCAKCIYGYLAKMKDTVIRICVDRLFCYWCSPFVQQDSN
jgi:hypothetical protein